MPSICVKGFTIGNPVSGVSRPGAGVELNDAKVMDFDSLAHREQVRIKSHLRDLRFKCAAYMLFYAKADIRARWVDSTWPENFGVRSVAFNKSTASNDAIAEAFNPQ